MKPPTGQKLADAMARMLGWKNDKFLVGHWIILTGSAIPKIDWRPHLSFDQCRIVEDWIWKMGRWERFIFHLGWITKSHSQNWNMRSSPLQRCQAAWLAYKESTKGKL